MTDWNQRLLYNNMGLKPFNSRTNKQRDVGYGGPSTERLMTIGDGIHEPIQNIPSIWWDRNGNPVELGDQEAIAMALMAEQSEGRRMPTYRTIEDAINSAKFRSENGGAYQSNIWDYGDQVRFANRLFRR